MAKLPILSLGKLEMACLECLWNFGEGGVKRVHGKIGTRRNLTINTIQSTLERLYRKGLLSRNKVSHAFIYKPTGDRAGLMTRAIDAVLDQFKGNEPSTFLTAFVDIAERTDAKTLSALEDLVAQRINGPQKQR